MTTTWWCQAYGPPPEGDRQAAEGAWPVCFVAAGHPRRCGTPDECAEVMAGERARVFSRINELAVDGGEHAQVYRHLADEIPTPGATLGGPDTDDTP